MDWGDGREERERQAGHADSTWKQPSLGGVEPLEDTESGQDLVRVPPLGTCMAHSLFEKRSGGEWKMMRRTGPSHPLVLSLGKEDVGCVDRQLLETCCFWGSWGAALLRFGGRGGQRRQEQGVVMAFMQHLAGPVAEPSFIP